ncbi:MAG TPA: YifB family Mg chelatase-like AAA ATPase, partial [Burkholderiaceae bacterium]|nr:YifB family Mg chelatase-like AAA ATPase [Burkholderiaceae bacterium]
ALGVLLASGQIQLAEQDDAGLPPLQRHVFAGELSLTGAIVSVDAPLAIALAVARTDAGATLVLPADCAPHAARVPGLTVLAACTLAEIVEHLAGRLPLSAVMPPATHPSDSASSHPCLSEVRGQAMARRVLEIAAAGGHSMLMSGPPGTGKSMLAHRLPGLLPRLSTSQALEVAALHGVSGRELSFSDVPPFRAPHHSASAPALVGGGAHPRPGEISLAHHGVLFLDELPEFQRRVLESLREPMETGCVAIARSARTLTFPASFQLIAAMNPCPCGWLGHPRKPCTCSAERIEQYRSRLSGPLLDRIDLQISLPSADQDWVDAPAGEASGPVRRRVESCRALQLLRQGRSNASLGVNDIAQHCPMDVAAGSLLKQAMLRWSWSSRVVHRLLRVARTLADLSHEECIGSLHVAEAIQYRQPWGQG